MSNYNHYYNVRINYACILCEGNVKKTKQWNLAILIKFTILKSYSCLNDKKKRKKSVRQTIAL